MTINSNILSDRSRAIIETIRMRLNEKQSLEYLKDAGFDIGPATYYREKRKIEELKLKRLYHIAKIGFQDQHLERIDIYEMGFKMMWQNVLLEKDPYKRNSMIKDILLLQPYLSAYYEATKLVIDKQPSTIVLESEVEEEKEQIESEQNKESNSLPTIKRYNTTTEQYTSQRRDSTSNNRKF